MGQKVRGHGLIGYDPEKKKFIGSWHESGSPFPASMEGIYDKETNKTTYMMKAKGPDGNDALYKIIMQHTDEENRTFEMHAKSPTGDFVKIMVIKYKKR